MDQKQCLIYLAGGVRELAELLGIKHQAVYAWDKVPQGRIYELMVKRPLWFDAKGRLIPVKKVRK